MTLRDATSDDVELLIKLRLDFISMMEGELSDDTKQKLKLQLSTYYHKHLSSNKFIATLAEDNGQVIATAFMVIGEIPAGASFITGITGTILNVMTYPEYRKRGCATMLIEALIQKGKTMNISAIDLFATESGKGVYQNLGFASIHNMAMRLKL